MRFIHSLKLLIRRLTLSRPASEIELENAILRVRVTRLCANLVIVERMAHNGHPHYRISEQAHWALEIDAKSIAPKEEAHESRLSCVPR